MTTWYLLNDSALSGSVNMAVDEFLLTQNSKQPVFRLYQWTRPTLSLGVSQKVRHHVEIDTVKKRQIPVVRRLTGGKAVLHDQELTYSLIGPKNEPPFDQGLLDSYCDIARAFCLAFETLGIDASMAPRKTRSSSGGVTSCFANPSAYEIVVSGKKLLGSAQKRTRSGVLQHGSLLIEYNESDWNAVMRKRGIVEKSGRIISLREILGDKFDINRLREELVSAFAVHFQVEFEDIDFSDSDWKEIERMAEEKYPDLSNRLDSE